MQEKSAPGTLGSMYWAPKSTNISFSVLSPPVMWQASQTPSPDPDDESQSALPVHGAAILPATQATGVHLPMDCCATGGTREARVTVSTLGESSAFRPLLYVAQ